MGADRSTLGQHSINALDCIAVTIAPGVMLANAFQVRGLLGQGTMGRIFAAVRVADRTPVAVKVLRPECALDHDAAERLRREAIVATKIHSHHVARMLDVAHDPIHGLIVAFELLEGETLERHIRAQKRISFEWAHPIGAQILRGLADAHAVGVIHRDLKPSNVFLERLPDGLYRVKILDFGVSKLPKEEGFEVLTKRWQNLGTFAYMPPEQIGTPSRVDHRADLYACGAVLFRMLAGQPPHEAKSVGALIMAKKHQPPRTLNAVLAHHQTQVSPALEAFVAKLLSMTPEARYQSANEALQDWMNLRYAINVGSSSLPNP